MKPLGIILIVVVTGAVVGGGVYAWQNAKHKTQQNVLSDQITTLESDVQKLKTPITTTPTPAVTQDQNSAQTTPTPSATTTIDDIANWTTFNSAFFKLSFKVPNGFEVTEDQNRIRVSLSPLNQYDNGDNSFFTLTRYSAAQNATNELASYRKTNGFKNIQESTIVVDGSSFKTLQGTYNIGNAVTAHHDSSTKYVFFDLSSLQINDETYDPNTKSKLNIKNFMEIGNQILSTFKFSSTNPTLTANITERNITELARNFEAALEKRDANKALNFYTDPISDGDKSTLDFLRGTDIGSMRLFATRGAGALVKYAGYEVKKLTKSTSISYTVELAQKKLMYDDQTATWNEKIVTHDYILVAKLISGVWKVDKFYQVGMPEKDQKYNGEFAGLGL